MEIQPFVVLLFAIHDDLSGWLATVQSFHTLFFLFRMPSVVESAKIPR